MQRSLTNRPGSWKAIALSVAAVSLIVLIYLSGRIIPPVFGRVVEATTGRGIPNINVVMQESHYEGWSVETSVVRATSTHLFGWFFVPPSFQWRPGGPLSQFRGYWMAVNEDRNGSMGGEEESADGEILYNPTFNRGGVPIGNPTYFPKTVTFGIHSCNRAWSCAHKWIWWGISVPLVSVHDSPEDCKRIAIDWSLREQCRQTVMYHAAFVHVDTYEQVQEDKQLCSEVDHGRLSAICIEELPVYIAMVHFYNPQSHPAIPVAVPAGMFPDSIAGLPAMTNRHCGPRLLFDGRLDCAGGYGTTAKEAVAVYTEQWPEGSKKPREYSHQGNQTPGATEVRADGKILLFEGRWYSGVQRADGKFIQYEHNSSSYVWYSGNTLVEVLFYDPLPEQEQFLSYYLGKFPSTSR